jgi:hypothetical protein
MGPSMKYVIEFGVRGGAHTENLIVPTQKLAQEIARKLVLAFTNDPHHPAAAPIAWHFPRACPRQTWQSPTHYVSVSKLDGIMRGPASATLWRKPTGPEPASGLVVPQNT